MFNVCANAFEMAIKLPFHFHMRVVRCLFGTPLFVTPLLWGVLSAVCGSAAVFLGEGEIPRVRPPTATEARGATATEARSGTTGTRGRPAFAVHPTRSESENGTSSSRKAKSVLVEAA